MSEITRLQMELADSRAEVQRLREQMSLGTPTVHKDLSLVSLIPKWSSSESETPLEEFLSAIDATARLGKWQEVDELEVATLRLTGPAKIFFNGCVDLHTEGVTWDQFKQTFRERFKDVHTDQFHFTNLHTAKQIKNESPRLSPIVVEFLLRRSYTR